MPRLGPPPGAVRHGAYDYAALARASDGLVAMAYDEHTEAGPAGPIASRAYLRRNLEALTRIAPPDKILMDLAAFGFDWPRHGPGQYLSHSDAVGIAHAVGANVRSDTRRGAAWFSYGGPDGPHDVFFEDARTWADKLNLARAYRLKGVAIWRLGMEGASA